MATRRRRSAVRSALRELLEGVLLVALVFFIFRGALQNFRIDGQSMEPNFHDHQYIWVNKLVYFHYDANALMRLVPGNENLPREIVYPYRTPERGDVVVLEPPGYDESVDQEDYIKRVIGLPGETIQIKDGQVFIDDEPLEEERYLDGTTDCYGGRLCEEYRIPEGHVVVLGDNRDNSQDSRTWNDDPALPFERIVGKAWLTYWPQDQWGFVASPTYAETP